MLHEFRGAQDAERNADLQIKRLRSWESACPSTEVVEVNERKKLECWVQA
jgi:hypothetical protein